MNFTLITTIFAFKRKKFEKVRVLKAHIGGKIMTFIVQDRQKNIQPAASNSNSESATDSYRVKRIVGPTNSNFLELNVSRDQAADSQQEQEAEETIPESSASRYGRKRKRVLRENYVPRHYIHREM